MVNKPLANCTLTPLVLATGTCLLVLLLTENGLDCWFVGRTVVLAETHPMVGWVSAALSASVPRLTVNPDASGVMRYHCGRFRSTTIRVTGGTVENRLIRTPRTSPRLMRTPRKAGPGKAFGMSITKRSGAETICVCGTTGVLV